MQVYVPSTHTYSFQMCAHVVSRKWLAPWRGNSRETRHPAQVTSVAAFVDLSLDTLPDSFYADEEHKAPTKDADATLHLGAASLLRKIVAVAVRGDGDASGYSRCTYALNRCRIQSH